VADGGAATLTALALALISATGLPAKAVRSVPFSKSSDSDFPFVYIEAADYQTDNTSSGSGFVETFNVHVFSRSLTDPDEVVDLCSLIHTAVDEVAFSVAGKLSALGSVLGRRLFSDPDQRTRHGIVTVEIIHRNS
jgi:uncharacterized protein DUF3168